MLPEGPVTTPAYLASLRMSYSQSIDHSYRDHNIECAQKASRNTQGERVFVAWIEGRMIRALDCLVDVRKNARSVPTNIATWKLGKEPQKRRKSELVSHVEFAIAR